MPFDPMRDDYCTFKVKDNGVWYTIDAEHPYADLYPDIPEDVCSRAEKAVQDASDENIGTDVNINPAPFYEEALRKEFDAVEFLGTDFEPGRIY